MLVHPSALRFRAGAATIPAFLALLVIIACVAPAQAQSPVALPIYPVNGATNVDVSQGFEWTAVPDAQAYYLYVGSVAGAKDLIDSGELHQTRYPAITLPAGSLVYARLWTKAAEVWSYVDFSFTTSSAAWFGFIHPPPSSLEAAMTRPFEWTSVANAQAYYLYVGTAPRAKDLVDTGEIQQTTYLAFNLPTGRLLYARIWAKTAGVWGYVDTTFIATTAARQLAQFVYPSDGAVNADLTVPIQWTSVVNAQAYYLYVGTSPGASDVINTGETLQTSYRAPGLPVGQRLYARLWTKVWDTWRYVDISFTVDPAAAGFPGTASFLYPANGASNVDTTQSIRWTSVPDAQAYYLYVGRAPGLKDIIDSGEIQRTSYPAWGLPATGTLYARIYVKTRGVWRYTEIAFTAAPLTSTLIAPANGATAVNPTRPFQWTSVPSKQAYYLYVGSVPGAKDLIDSQETQRTSWSPLNGGKSQGLGQVWTSRQLFARLWTKIGGVWRYADSTFTTVALAAIFVYPLDGAAGVDVTVPFQWTRVPNAQRYRLTIHRVCQGHHCDHGNWRDNRHDEPLVDTGEIRHTSYVVQDLPHNGTLHGRIWTKVDGTWRYTDIVFTRMPHFCGKKDHEKKSTKCKSD